MCVQDPAGVVSQVGYKYNRDIIPLHNWAGLSRIVQSFATPCNEMKPEKQHLQHTRAYIQTSSLVDCQVTLGYLESCSRTT